MKKEKENFDSKSKLLLLIRLVAAGHSAFSATAVTVVFCHTSRKHYWILEKEDQTCSSLYLGQLFVSPVLGLSSMSSNLCSSAQVNRRVSSLKLDCSDLRGMFVCCVQVAAKSTAFLMSRMISQKESSALPSPE